MIAFDLTGSDIMSDDTYTEECSICVGRMNDVTIIELAGEIDIATVSLLAKALSDAVKKGKGPVVLDAHELTYIDSAGLQTLLSSHRKLAETGRSLTIVGCHGIFHKLMKITRFEEHFTMYPTIEDALQNLSPAA